MTGSWFSVGENTVSSKCGKTKGVSGVSKVENPPSNAGKELPKGPSGNIVAGIADNIAGIVKGE